MKRSVVYVPQESANDDHAILTAKLFKDGEQVNSGEDIASFETTKMVFEVEAEEDGYIYYLADLSDDVAIGSVFAIISDSDSEKVQELKETYSKDIKLKKIETADAGQEKLNGSKKTLKQKFLEKQQSATNLVANASTEDIVDSEFFHNRQERIVIIGGGRGAVQVIDAINAGNNHQRIVGILDDTEDLQGKRILGIPVLGEINLSTAKNLIHQGVADKVVISISSSVAFREEIFTTWSKEGVSFANIIHPKAHIGMNVKLGQGNIILAFSHIGACAVVENNNFLSPYVDIEHHCYLGSNCSFGPACYFSSNVTIKDSVRFGTGIYCEPFHTIGEGSIISSGLTLTKSIPAKMIAKSRPEITLKPL